MVFTFQPPFFAGLSGYVAEIGSGLICAQLDLPNELHDTRATSPIGSHFARGQDRNHSAASKAEQAFNRRVGDSDDTASSAEGVRQILEAA
jgi:hypothetical protein